MFKFEIEEIIVNRNGDKYKVVGHDQDRKWYNLRPSEVLAFSGWYSQEIIEENWTRVNESSAQLHFKIETGCNHTKKFINRMIISKFWYCPDCKKDLGDA